MTRETDQLHGQMVLGTTQHLVQEGLPKGVDPERRISLQKLLTVIGSEMHFGRDASFQDYLNSEPEEVKKGLYVHPTDPHYHTAQHVIRVGISGRHRPGVATRDFGVVFPPHEYPIVGRNASDLGRATVSRTARVSRQREPSIEDAEATAMRSAGHMLRAKLDSQTRLGSIFNEELGTFAAVFFDLTEPNRTRYKARNIEKRRGIVDEKLHETLDIASVLLSADSVALAGMHKAVQKRLYGQHLSSAATTANWVRYLRMINQHTIAKREKLRTSYEMCREELKKYQPFLDAKRPNELEVA